MTREEALNKVRQMSLPKETMEILEALVPELAESEDERIRKRLIEYFEGFRMGNAEVKWEGLNVQEVLVWLEKQKDLDKMIVVSPEVWDNAITDAYENGKRDSEKQQEQNLIMANSPQLKEQKQEKFPPYVTGFKGDPDPAGVWKPSKEQMRALNEIVNILAASPFLHQNDYLFNILNGLRKELKKLL